MGFRSAKSEYAKEPLQQQQQQKTVLEMLKRAKEYPLWFIQLFGRIHSTICLRMQTGNEIMWCQLEAQVLEPTSVTLFCLNS